MTKPTHPFERHRRRTVSAAVGLAEGRGSEGFTLIELIIVIAILPLIMGGIAVALITTLTTTASTANRIGDSADAQVTSAFYVRDVQSAMDLTTSSAATDPAECASGAPVSASSTLLLGLYWAGTGSTDSVTSYWLVATPHTPAATTYQLVRSSCQNASATSTSPISPTSTSALALDPSAASSAATVTCATTVSCASYSIGWVTTAGISGVSLSALEPGSSYSYTLTATPRSWNPTSGGLPAGGSPLPPLTLLGSGVVIGISAQNDQVNVDGGLGFNGAASNAIDISASNSTITDTGGSFDVYGCGSPCNVVDTTASGDSYTGPAATSTSTAFQAPTDPEPNTSQLAAASCTNVGKVYTCPPGKYAANAFSFLSSGNTFTVNFTGPANSDGACAYCYEFQGELQATTQNNTLNFTGTQAQSFVFDAGLVVSAAGTSVEGTGVFLYIAGGPFEVTSQSNTVSLSPQSSGANAGVLLYQPASDTSEIEITASGNTTDSYGGSIIAAGAAISISGQNTTLDLGPLLATGLAISASTVTININT